LPENTPSELLLRRPDLAAAEQQLLAGEANLEAARKAFFPTIGLSAFGGRESADLSDLFTGPAKIWSFQSQITQPIFQAGRLTNERDAAIARRNQAVLQYEASVRTAFQEIYDAIVAQREARERLQARQEQVQTLTQVVRLAQLRVDNGVANQLELLDAQRNLLNAQLSWAAAWQSQQGATLAMIRALGGGFNAEQVALKE
jgi:outer membrane protein, multidrug efflux system